MAKNVWSLYKEDEDGQQAAQHLYDNPRDAVAVARRAVRKDIGGSGKQAQNLKLGKNAAMYTTEDRGDPKYVITKQPVKSFAFRK